MSNNLKVHEFFLDNKENSKSSFYKYRNDLLKEFIFHCLKQNIILQDCTICITSDEVESSRVIYSFELFSFQTNNKITFYPGSQIFSNTKDYCNKRNKKWVCNCFNEIDLTFVIYCGLKKSLIFIL